MRALRRAISASSASARVCLRASDASRLARAFAARALTAAPPAFARPLAGRVRCPLLAVVFTMVGAYRGSLVATAATSRRLDLYVQAPGPPHPGAWTSRPPDARP